MASLADEDRGSKGYPPPRSVSPEAQRSLAAVWSGPADYPPLHDHAAWREMVAGYNEQFRQFLTPFAGDRPVTRGTIADVPVACIEPANATERAEDQVYLDLHGGALIYCGGDYLDLLAQRIAGNVQMNVISIDYRMPPDHPYPAGLRDCLKVYRALVNERGADNIVVGGTSAGGNLAVAMMLMALDEGLPAPAGLVLLSPEVDLTESGDTFQVLNGVDRMSSLMPVNLLYAAGAPLDHPHVSPLFGEFKPGFPRTFIQSGTRDLFLSNAVRLHRSLRRAQIPAELHVWEAYPHGGFFNAPEDAELSIEIRTFIATCFSQGQSGGA